MCVLISPTCICFPPTLLPFTVALERESVVTVMLQIDDDDVSVNNNHNHNNYQSFIWKGKDVICTFSCISSLNSSKVVPASATIVSGRDAFKIQFHITFNYEKQLSSFDINLEELKDVSISNLSKELTKIPTNTITLHEEIGKGAFSKAYRCTWNQRGKPMDTVIKMIDTNHPLYNHKKTINEMVGVFSLSLSLSSPLFYILLFSPFN